MVLRAKTAEQTRSANMQTFSDARPWFLNGPASVRTAVDLGPPRSNDPPELHLGAASIADVQCGEYLQFGIGDTKSLATQCSMLPKILHPLLQTYTCDTRDDPMESHYAYVRMYYIYICVCIDIYGQWQRERRKKTTISVRLYFISFWGFYVKMYIHGYVWSYIHIRQYTYTHICMYVCMYVCIYVLCMYVCMLLFIHWIIDLSIHLFIYLYK